jgi:hypothetical protein
MHNKKDTKITEISRVALFGKLNPVCYKGIESATVFCKMRGNPYVELVHWLHQRRSGVGWVAVFGQPNIKPRQGLLSWLLPV